MDIMIINGPNLNLLGSRKTAVYGTKTLQQINAEILQFASQFNVHVNFFQSNSEGQIIDQIHKSANKYNGIVLNAGAYTHYSYAIADAIEAVDIPVIEVHLSNIHKREEFRKKSVLAPFTAGQITGFGYYSYILAISALINIKKEGESWKE